MEKKIIIKVLEDFCNDYHNYNFYTESDIEWTLYKMLENKLNKKTEKIFREYNQILMKKPYFFTKSYIDTISKGNPNLKDAFTEFSGYYFLKNEFYEDQTSKIFIELSEIVNRPGHEKKHCDIAITKNEVDKPITESTFNKYTLIIELKYEPATERMVKGSIIKKKRRLDKKSILKDLCILKLIKLANKDKDNVEYLFTFFDEGDFYKDFKNSNFLSDYLKPDLEYISKGLEFKEIIIPALNGEPKGICYYRFV